jgi:asparagine synthase (glutamine-hydrolysing)
VCGICGTVALGAAPLEAPDAVERLRGALRHRGPDGEGLWRSDHAALGATRLRVVDLDPRADQPFTDPAGLVLVCNGEIYNAAALRRRYAAYPFRSRSDVEVLLPLYLERGPHGLDQLDGMFAVAIWDAGRALLTLARDRAGEKPLFYAERGGEVWFASEIGALLAAPGVSRIVDRDALAEYVRLGYVREPRTPFAAIRKVPAGTILTLAARGGAAHRYWDPVDRTLPAPDAPSVRRLLEHAVAKQVAADVPIGVFTSGGLDSSLLAALAVRALGADRVHTFTVGFRDRDYDERRFAARLARQLGTRHVEIEVAEADVPAALDALAASGEPIGDPAAIPTLLLAGAARERVTVVLSGEGGDELFGGYPTYLGHLAAARFAQFPAALRRGVRGALSLVPPSSGRVPFEFLLKRFVAVADRPWVERHQAWFGTGLPPEILRPTWREGPPLRAPDPDDPDVLRQAMRLDYETALRERLLVKGDRATMRVALEARAPFLDADLTRAALSAPSRVHVRGLRTKILLRDVARGSVPEFIVRRGKRGLSVPVGRWLNGPLAAVANEQLRRDRLDRQGLLDGAAVARLMAEHRAGRADHGRALWPLLMLQHWVAYWRLEVGR